MMWDLWSLRDRWDMFSSGALAEAILNGLWQGLVVAFLVLLLLRFAGRLDAGLKHSILFLALCSVAATPLLNLLQPAKTTATKTLRSPHGTVERIAATGETETTTPSLRDSRPNRQEPRAGASTSPRASASHAVPGPTKPAPSVVPTVRIPGGWWISIALGSWLVISLVSILRLIASVLSMRSLLRRSQLPPPRLSMRLAGWLERLEIRRPLNIRISDELGSPSSIGLGQRVILIPTDMAEQWAAEDFDPVILHEVAHLVRRDDWTNLASRILAALLPFHPALTMLERRMREEREIACDSWALRWFRSPERYASALLRVADRPHRIATPTFGHAMASGSKLSRRISHILRGDVMNNPAAPRFLLIASALTLCALVFTCTKNPKVQVETASTPRAHVSAPAPPVAPVAPSLRDGEPTRKAQMDSEQTARDTEREAQKDDARRDAERAERGALRERRQAASQARKAESAARRERAHERRRTDRHHRKRLRELRETNRQELSEVRERVREELREAMEVKREALRESLREMRDELRERLRDQPDGSAGWDDDARRRFEQSMEHHQEELERETEGIEHILSRELEQMEQQIERSLQHLSHELELVGEELESLEPWIESESLARLEALESVGARGALEALENVDAAELLKAFPLEEIVTISTTGALDAVEEALRTLSETLDDSDVDDDTDISEDPPDIDKEENDRRRDPVPLLPPPFGPNM